MMLLDDDDKIKSPCAPYAIRPEHKCCCAAGSAYPNTRRRRYTVGDTFTSLDSDTANELLDGEIEKLQQEVRFLVATCSLGPRRDILANCSVDPTPDPAVSAFLLHCPVAESDWCLAAAQMEKQEEELNKILETQSELKTHLYAKFGKSINLEE